MARALVDPRPRELFRALRAAPRVAGRWSTRGAWPQGDEDDDGWRAWDRHDPHGVVLATVNAPAEGPASWGIGSWRDETLGPMKLAHDAQAARAAADRELGRRGFVLVGDESDRDPPSGRRQSVRRRR